MHKREQGGKVGESASDKARKLADAMRQGGTTHLERDLTRAPKWEPTYSGSSRLLGKVALITGGDSGIGRAVAALFAREGANVVINYLSSDADAAETQRIVEAEGRSALLVRGDVGNRAFCEMLVRIAVDEFGRLDILVNNAGEQHPAEDIRNISDEQLRRTFQTNVFSMFYLTQAALEHLKAGSAIINCSSVTMYEGSAQLLDYSATKGAVTAFTRSLSAALAHKGIRVNSVAPGPIWTPLNPMGGANVQKVMTFGEKTPMERPGEPNEVAPSFLFLACDDSSYMTGQTLHPNGGTIVNG